MRDEKGNNPDDVQRLIHHKKLKEVGCRRTVRVKSMFSAGSGGSEPSEMRANRGGPTSPKLCDFGAFTRPAPYYCSLVDALF